MAIKKPYRPVLDIPMTPLQQMMIVAGAIGVIVGFGIVARYWPDLPQTIPTHFNGLGKPDGWGGKSSLLAVPIIGLVLYAMMMVLSRFPQIYNFPVTITEENAADQYQMARTLVIWLGTFIPWMFTYLGWMSVQNAMQKAEGLGGWFLPATLVVCFAPLIVYLMKASRIK